MLVSGRVIVILPRWFSLKTTTAHNKSPQFLKWRPNFWSDRRATLQDIWGNMDRENPCGGVEYKKVPFPISFWEAMKTSPKNPKTPE